MRIALIATADNPHTLRWARYLAASGHELLCLCDKPGPNGFRVKPPCEIRHPAPNLAEAALCFKILRHPDGWNWFRARCYRNEVRRFRPDVVHAMEAYAYGFALSKCKGFPRVLTPWGNDIFVDPFRTRLAGYLVRGALRHVEAITTNMPNLADYLEPQFGVNRERVRAFSWGIDLGIFHDNYQKEAAELRKRWELPDGAFVILSPRQMREYWGMVEIVEAFERVAARRPNAHIVFLRGMGQPGLEERLRQRLEAAGVGGRVRWIGEVLDARGMAAAFNLANVFISVPKSDMLSISVLEGMGCGCLPVAADLLAYRSRLKHRENALLVPMPVTGEKLAEAILAAADHPEWRPEFAAKNLAIIREQDDWKKNAPLMEEVYRWAIANPLNG